VRAWPILATGFTLLSLTTVAPLVSMAFARDHGVMGQTWPIAEPDFLSTIDATLKTLEGSGCIERMQSELVA
jgi:conjugal transfer pilus assembly protein TraW